jgi:starch-binding outer membrane protein, SusD/RagB family
MNKNIIIKVAASLIIGSVLISCKKEFIDTSRPLVSEVIKDVDGLMNLSAGLPRRFSIGRQSPMYNSCVGGGYGILSLTTPNQGNIAEAEIETGGSGLPNTNAMVTGLWRESLLLKTEAETILNNLSVADNAQDKAGLKAYASIFYGLSVGTLCQFYEQVPLENKKDANFVSRDLALQKLISVLESADTGLTTIVPSTKFLSKIPAGIDIKNTVKALLARYYNIHSMVTGTYNAVSGNKAINFALAVNATVKSEFRFTGAAQNPIGTLRGGSVFILPDSSLGLKNGLAPTPFYATDPRIGFYVAKPATAILVKGNTVATTTSFPIYLPGEMQLIIAENYARQNAFPLCLNALNAVRQKTTDIYGVNANQPAYSGVIDQPSLLTDIYKQRRIELYMSGMELEDSRRFNRPAPGASNQERNRNFYPYPRDERDNNTNTPVDPAI